jgi:hypothetical protein
MHNDYALRHLAYHLRESDQNDSLFALTDRYDWFATQAIYDPSGSSYRADLTELWSVAREADTPVEWRP